MHLKRRPRIHYSDTPIGDLLYHVVDTETMPTWNRHRGRRCPDRGRVVGGEWDYIRSLPLRTRQRLTGAGFMSKHGTTPDDFAELIRLRAPGMGDATDTACHEWFVRHALLALAERRRANHYDRHLAYARSRGAPSYYALRNAEAYLDGYDSLWHKRKAKGWA